MRNSVGTAGKKQGKNFLWALIIGAIASALVVIVADFSLFKTWELKTYDMRMTQVRGNRPVPENVVMFYVDEESLRYMETQGINWPWPRELYASVMDFGRRSGARAVVFDLFFSEDSVYGVGDDDAFAAGVTEGPPSYFAIFLSKNPAPVDPRQDVIIDKSIIPFNDSDVNLLPVEDSIISLPIRPLVDAAVGFGNVQVPPDDDGVYRRLNLVEKFEKFPFPSLALKVASDVGAMKQISYPGKTRLILDEVHVPLDSDGRMMINYYGGADTFPAYSLAKVIVADAEIAKGAKPSIDPDVIKDKVVVVGVAAPGLYETKATPYSRVYPGPEVHATVIENLLTNDFITPVHRSAAIFMTVVCAVVVAGGLVYFASSLGIGLWIIAILSLIVGSAFLFFLRGVWVPLVMPLGASAISAFAMIIYKFMTEGRKKREIRRAFGQYLSPEVVKEIANDPDSLKLGGIQKEITVFFSDIANFTSISEKMDPAELVERLNEYFSKTTRIIHEHGGTLDKYIGDAIMAFWGAPVNMTDHATQAVRAALGIQKALGHNSNFNTRIGIHTNPAIVGNIGSDIRFNYTAIGDSVNLASRLEGLNKKYGSNIIISESTYAKTAVEIEARRIGRVRVKGRDEPVGIFEPIGIKGDFGRLGFHVCEKFAEALALFESARFNEASVIFRQLIKDVNDEVSKKLLDICEQFTQNPPDKFDGVVTFTSK